MAQVVEILACGYRNLFILIKHAIWKLLIWTWQDIWQSETNPEESQPATDISCTGLLMINSRKFISNLLIFKLPTRMIKNCTCLSTVNLPPAQQSCWGVYWFHSVHPSVRPASRVRSLVPTVLVGTISYLYILSSNFRRCVACKVACKIFKIWIFGNFFKLVTLTLSSLTLDLVWIPSMGNHVAAVGISERRRSSCSSYTS